VEAVGPGLQSSSVRGRLGSGLPGGAGDSVRTAPSRAPEDGTVPTTPLIVEQFLAAKRIAVVGVSRDSRQAANLMYRKLRARGAEVVAVNPGTDRVEGDPCYPSLEAVPGRVDAVMIVTRPEVTAEIVRTCAKLGIPRVWMHRGIGHGSVSDPAVAFCRENGISVIAGACPMMYLEPVDLAHRCFRVILGWRGKLPSGSAG